ncbi:MAG: transcription elongation factor GreA [Acidimicrobiia bacterium]|nr:transcription elongation factor GreA [Acidimicrobiia bacterium]
MTDDTKTWLTPAAHQKLVEELEYLTTEGRNEVTQRISEARDHGDLRENAEYDTAKNDQGLMEARIRQIKATLDNAEIREAADDGTVGVGSVVTCIDDDGDEMEFFVAPPENKVAGILLASPSSPLGGALMGAKPGDKVSYQAPGGKFTYEVKSIRPYEG